MLIHITGNYPYHSLFSELVRSIHSLGIEQRIIVPMRNGQGENVNIIELPNVQIKYIDMYDNMDRVLYFRKMRKGYSKLLSVYPNWNKHDVIIAHTAFSDGGLAYRLNQQFGIPYVVCIRNTDINSFLKYKPYLRNAFAKILQQAKIIIVLSHGYNERVLNYISESNRPQIREKICNIPNGIHPFWFNENAMISKMQNPLKLLFVGELDRNKNVLSILKAQRSVIDRGLLCNFNIVGDGTQRERLKRAVSSLGLSEYVTFSGWKNTKQELLEAYRNADIFIMPSLRETFGTVYLEAMTQGLPCIYTRGEGIDGWFEDEEIGKAVDPLNIQQIADAIVVVKKNYAEMSARCIRLVQNFQWDTIAHQYLEASGISIDELEK